MNEYKMIKMGDCINNMTSCFVWLAASSLTLKSQALIAKSFEFRPHPRLKNEKNHSKEGKYPSDRANCNVQLQAPLLKVRIT